MKPDPKNLQAEQTQPCSQRPAHTSRHSSQANILVHTLANYVQKFAPTQGRLTGNKLQLWNKLIGLASHAIADLLAACETSRDSWHNAAINSQSHFSKVFQLSAAEGNLLAIYSQCHSSWKRILPSKTKETIS